VSTPRASSFPRSRFSRPCPAAAPKWGTERPTTGAVRRKLRKELTFDLVERLAAADPVFARVWQSYRGFMEESQAWQAISEQAYLETRN
jgi:hypothetical protein